MQTRKASKFEPRLLSVLAAILILPVLLILIRMSFAWPPFLGVLRLPEYQTGSYLIWAGYVLLSVTMITWQLYRPVFSPRPDLKPKPPLEGRKDILLALAGAVLFGWACTMAITYPLYWLASPGPAIAAKILDINHRAKKPECQSTLRVDADPGWLSEICISRSFAQSLHIGDQVLLSGRQLQRIAFFVERVDVKPQGGEAVLRDHGAPLQSYNLVFWVLLIFILGTCWFWPRFTW